MSEVIINSDIFGKEYSNMFYTIMLRHGLNNKRQVYTRAYVIYGRFIDIHSFKYNIVYNNKLITDDGRTRYCRTNKLLRRNNNKIYIFHTLEEAVELCKSLNKEYKKIPIRN